MSNKTKELFLKELSNRYGNIHKLEGSQSLYDLGEGAGRIYIRYSKVHARNQTFYGLREKDLRRLEGHLSVICFLWDNQQEPLFLPYSEYEEIFHSLQPASDGQYKAQVFLQSQGTDFYIANAGRFNVEAYFGWDKLTSIIDQSQLTALPDLLHVQVQTLLGSIGFVKGYDIWIPRNDRIKLDWKITAPYECRAQIPQEFNHVEDIIQEIDVIWFERGAGKLRALFEVEHSTPIYSGLLRLNDIHLLSPYSKATYSIVSNDDRRNLFVRQLNRPTFTMSTLRENCTFLLYPNVFTWHKRIVQGRQMEL
jgi:hypothetical protein